MTKAYAAFSATTPLKPHVITRRKPGAKDIALEVLFCGICHSDLHTARNEWKNTTYPCVPGHEIVGKVTATGAKVKKFKKGDLVAVGCLVDSCRTCSACRENLEQHCVNPIFTYNSPEKQTKGLTYGGYSKDMVVDEDFVLKVPVSLDPAAAAPLLCAGITTYSPLKRFGAGKGKKVGVVGLGGLGHMAVKFGSSFGSHVVVFTRSQGKEKDVKKLGGHETVISADPQAMKQHEGSFDIIIDTVSAKHEIDPYLALLKRSGTMVLVGAPEEPLAVASFSLIMQRKQLAGSLIGGLKETQEMLDYCGKHNIVCDIEKIPAQKINEAYERMLKSDVKYRFVIDMASL